MGIQDRIKDIEDEMARTQKNKATEYVALHVIFSAEWHCVQSAALLPLRNFGWPT
jgi:hypothetical protein